MNPSDVAQKLGNREGYRLVSFGYVGLPVFRISAECLVLEKSTLGTVDEFLFRAVQHGIDTSDGIAAFLGLPARVVDVQIADGIRQGTISSLASGELRLSAAGRRSLQENGATKPKEAMCSFTYDGLLRIPQHYPKGALLSPAELRALSIPEIRAIPSRRPELDELDIDQVDIAVRAAVNASRQPTTSSVLRLNGIHRTQRLFLRSIALLFRSNSSDELQVSFAIDGRASKEHEQMFSRSGGIEKTRLFANLVPANPTRDLEKDVDPILADRIRELPVQEPKRTGRPILRLRPRRSEEDASKAARDDAVRILTVAQHHPLLIDALNTAKKRLLIISPWVRRDVVDQQFIEKLAECLDRDVKAYIGYGIGDRDKNKEIDRECHRDLSRLAAANSNFRFQRLGNTHAKILLKDNAFFVVSSFNWLSFRGDPRRPFREELGNMVSIPKMIDDFFDDLEPRFNGDQ